MPPEPPRTLWCHRWPRHFRAWLLLLMVAAALASCQRAPPEQRLRESVQSLQEAIQRREATSMHEWLAQDFVGPEGLDRDGAKRMAQLVYLKHRDIGVVLGPMQVDLGAGHATVAFTALLTGGSGGLLPDTGRMYDVRTGWRLDGNDWRLTSAHWTATSQ